jgi:hypothetical protein
LHVRINPSILADISNGSFGGFRHVCDDLSSGSCRAPTLLEQVHTSGARLHPNMGNAKLRKSWNKGGEVSVVQGLRGVSQWRCRPDTQPSGRSILLSPVSVERR